MINVTIPGQFKNQTVTLTSKNGGYVDGIWVAGVIDPRVIKVSAQPVPPSDYRLLPEGGSPQLALEIFWSGVFSMGLNGETPDEVTDKGGII